MNQPIDDLVRRQFGELSTYQRSHPGHDRGGKTGASRNQQRIIRAVNRIDQAVVTGESPTTSVPGAEMETQGPAILILLSG